MASPSVRAHPLQTGNAVVTGRVRFNPFSLSAWRSAFSGTGMLGIALIAVATSGKLFEVREASDVVMSAANSSTILRLFALLVAVSILAPRITRIYVPRSLYFRSFGIFALICLASTLWSSSALATIGKAAELLVGWLVVSALARGPSGHARLISALHLLFYYMAAQVTIVTLLYMLGVPGFSERGAGGITELLGSRSVAPFISANSLGYYSAALILVVCGLFLSRKISVISALSLWAVFSVTLLCSGSRTSLLIVFIGVAALWLIRKRLSVLAPVLFLCFLVAAVNFYAALEFLQGDVSDSVFFSLSGRTVLWQAAVDAWLLNPIIGYGYGVGSRTAFTLIDMSGFLSDISSVHNGFLEVLLGVGVVGFVPWIISVLGLVAIFLKSRRNREVFSYAGGICLVVLATTFMSLGAGGAMSELVLLMLIAFVLDEKSEAEGRVP